MNLQPRLRQSCADSPQLREVFTAMGTPSVARLRNALSIFTSSARVAFATAFLDTRASLLLETDPEQASRSIA